MPGKVAEDGPCIWAPATEMGDMDGVPGSWLWHGPVLAVEAIWGVDQ